jgi:hypothetical protein
VKRLSIFSPYLFKWKKIVEFRNSWLRIKGLEKKVSGFGTLGRGLIRGVPFFFAGASIVI